MMLSQITVAIGISVFVAYWINSHRQRWTLPPGPKKLPLIGNLLVMPTRLEWETFERWGKECNSDIIHVNALGTSVVILNSYKAATELLDKRSTIYSGRPYFTMFHELSGWGFLFVMLPYGNVWRTSRRLFAKHFSSSSQSINQPREVVYIRRFLGQLLHMPDDILRHIRTLVGSITLSMTYGIEVRPYNDPYIKIVEEAVEAVAPLTIAGTFLVDILPVLKYVPKWFPGAGFQRKADIMRQHADTIRNATFAVSEKSMARGNYESSFVTEGLRDIQNSNTPGADTDLLKDVAAQVYMAMVCYPEVQKKAQAELDKVLDGGLPQHSDIDSLPYLSAIVLEVYRWQPVLPLGIPHQSTSDDVYNNYRISANSVVIPNQWAMLNDERDYPEPRTFMPERFIKDGILDKSVRDPMDIAFGFGRRICPGQHLAHSIVTLTAASVLSTFDLLKKKDEDDNDIMPEGQYKPGGVRQPLDFPCVIKPRSRYAKDLIRSSSGLE